MFWFLFLLLAAVLLIAVSGIYVFIVACLRRKELPWLIKEEIEKTPYGKYYNQIAEAEMWLRGHNAQDWYITGEDCLRLHGIWVPAENPKATVIMVHGYRSTYLLDFGKAMEIYHSMGYNLLLPDQRSHGKSEGQYITFGVKESRDIYKWIEYHNVHCGNTPVVLSGLSMGASTVLYLADKELPSNVRCIVADCGFTSPREILSSVFKRVTHLPATASLWFTELLARAFAGFSLTQEDTRRSLKHSKLPVFMVHGTDDNFVPCEMTKQASALCSGKMQVLYVEGAEHGVSFLTEPETYKTRLLAFLNEHVGVPEINK